MSDYYPDIESVIDEAGDLREVVVLLSRCIPDAEAASYKTLFREWVRRDGYIDGEIVRYDDKLYRTVTVISTSTTPPPDDIYTWYEVDDGTISDWNRTTVYSKGDLVLRQKSGEEYQWLYVSLRDNNTNHRPESSEVPAYWRRLKYRPYIETAVSNL